MTPSDTNTKAIIKRLYEDIWNKRKLEVMSELVSPSHALHGPNLTGASVGPEAYRRQVALNVAAFPDLRWKVEDTIAERDKVVVVWSFTGTHQGEYMGVAATHKKVFVEGITIHHISNGKIMDSDSIWDMWGLMQQLGVAPALGRPQRAMAR